MLGEKVSVREEEGGKEGVYINNKKGRAASLPPLLNSKMKSSLQHLYIKRDQDLRGRVAIILEGHSKINELIPNELYSIFYLKPNELYTICFLKQNAS